MGQLISEKYDYAATQSTLNNVKVPEKPKGHVDKSYQLWDGKHSGSEEKVALQLSTHQR